jgi:hypothetical protein
LNVERSTTAFVNFNLFVYNSCGQEWQRRLIVQLRLNKFDRNSGEKKKLMQQKEIRGRTADTVSVIYFVTLLKLNSRKITS